MIEELPLAAKQVDGAEEWTIVSTKINTRDGGVEVEAEAEAEAGLEVLTVGVFIQTS